METMMEKLRSLNPISLGLPSLLKKPQVGIKVNNWIKGPSDDSVATYKQEAIALLSVMYVVEINRIIEMSTSTAFAATQPS